MNLYYVTEAFYILKELGLPKLESMVLNVLSAVDSGGGVQPNWMSHFVLMAAGVTDQDVWNEVSPQKKPETGEDK